MFAAEGLNVEKLLNECGIQKRDLDDPERRYPIEVTSRLWDLALAQTDRPNLGLNRQLCDRYGGMHLIGYAMMASPSLLEGLRTLQRYLPVVSEATAFEIEPDKAGYWVQLGLKGENNSAPRQRLEFGLLTVLMACTWFTRRDIRPLMVEVAYPKPRDFGPYRRAFLSEVQFDCASNRFLLSSEDMHTPLPTHDPVVARLHEQHLQAQLQKLGFTSTRYRVFTEIVRQLKHGEPRRADIAAGMHISERTLQRRLQDENVSFQEVLNNVRCELAKQYLADHRLPLSEVSDLLGFGDQSNFVRACKRWFGLSPGQLRATGFSQ